MDGSVVLAILR